MTKITFNISKLTAILFIIILTAGCTSKDVQSVAEEEDLTEFVNPFIGTAFTGHTFPGAAYPLGFMQPGPETGNFSWDYCSGYFYDETRRKIMCLCLGPSWCPG